MARTHGHPGAPRALPRLRLSAPASRWRALRIIAASGKPVFDGEGRFAGYRGVARDITKLRRAEEMLRDREQRIRDARLELARVSRVTTLGELAASIAHEINQPLAAIVADANASLNWLAPCRTLTSIGFATRSTPSSGTATGLLEVIQRIRQLATKGETERASVEINSVIRDVMPLLRRELQLHHVVAQADLAGGDASGPRRSGPAAASHHKSGRERRRGDGIDRRSALSAQ